jgi:hypothetical protein
MTRRYAVLCVASLRAGGVIAMLRVRCVIGDAW